MGKPIVERINVEFCVDETGCVVEVNKGNGDPGERKAPAAPQAWASAVVSTKHSPGHIYIYVNNHWVCI